MSSALAGRSVGPSVVGAAVAALTVARFGLGADGVAWALVQLLLVGIAVDDLRTRRIRNSITLSAGVVVMVTRIVFERGALPVTCAAAALCLLAFFGIAIVARGGLGMGDAKLAGLLGLLLGKAVVPALVFGTLAGAVAAAVVLVRHGRGRSSTLAYGPYLCAGAATAILVASLPPLV